MAVQKLSRIIVDNRNDVSRTVVGHEPGVVNGRKARRLKVRQHRVGGKKIMQQCIGVNLKCICMLLRLLRLCHSMTICVLPQFSRRLYKLMLVATMAMMLPMVLQAAFLCKCFTTVAAERLLARVRHHVAGKLQR